MSFRSSDASFLVCTSLLTMERGWSRQSVVNTINLNFPERDMKPEEVLEVLHYIAVVIPDWLEFVTTLNPSSEGFRLTVEFLHAGLLASKSVPPEALNLQGLQLTMGKIIFYARQCAIDQGSLERRSFDRTREGDAFGYVCDEYYHWWDHPGNLGF